LERVGLSHRRKHWPSELSGGEMQRAAIARALINEPSLLLADEPTGNLDSATSHKILELFQELNQDGLTVVVVTHSETLAQAAQPKLPLTDAPTPTKYPPPQPPPRNPHPPTPNPNPHPPPLAPVF